MPAIVGTVSLAIALVLALYGATVSVVGVRTSNAALVESARTSAYALLGLVAIANAAMLVALLTNDFSVSYVAENGSRETPTFFKVLSLWSADEGSLLLWNLVLAGYLGLVAYRFRRRRPETFPWAMAAMFAVSAFYLLLVLGPTTPFGTLSPAPVDGRGPLPLLQNHPLMALHPPFLYLGFIGFTVPFAFAIAGLITARVSDEWMRITRRWTMFAWVFLTTGLILGALWSYGVLGWGGYWAWDPVENVALLPWLTGTAFLHSVMVQERRGMLKVWNLSLIVGTFALTVLGTFLTRGSILSSVHTFAQSIVGPLYLLFLSLVLIGGFGLIAWRRNAMRAEGTFDSPVSRESVFLGNNMVLLVVMFTVLVGTIYPLLAEAVTDRKVSVGAPFFDRNVVPLAMLLLFLMAIGPLLPWRAGSGARLLARLRAPAWSAALVAAALALARAADPGTILVFGLVAFVAVATLGEMARGVRAFARAHGASVRSSIVGAVRRDRRLYGGLVVHLGLLVAVIGITSAAVYDRSTELTLRTGQTATFAGYDMRFDGVRTLDQPQRRVLVATLTVTDASSGDPVVVLTPSLNLYPGSSEPIGTPSIRTGTPGTLFRDLYSSLVSVDATSRSATFRLFLNPGIDLLWAGGAVMVVGGVLAAWPSRGPTPPPRPMPLAERTREEVAV
jgi:cytochrome c-type biogenesis protein CcmF